MATAEASQEQAQNSAPKAGKPDAKQKGGPNKKGKGKGPNKKGKAAGPKKKGKRAAQKKNKGGKKKPAVSTAQVGQARAQAGVTAEAAAQQQGPGQETEQEATPTQEGPQAQTGGAPGGGAPGGGGEQQQQNGENQAQGQNQSPQQQAGGGPPGGGQPDPNAQAQIEENPEQAAEENEAQVEGEGGAAQGEADQSDSPGGAGTPVVDAGAEATEVQEPEQEGGENPAPQAQEGENDASGGAGGGAGGPAGGEGDGAEGGEGGGAEGGEGGGDAGGGAPDAGAGGGGADAGDGGAADAADAGGGGGGGGAPDAGGGGAPAVGGGPDASSETSAATITDTVDHYMKTNWDKTDYQAHYARIGGAPTGPLGNPLLPVLNTVDNRTDSNGDPIPAPSASASSAATMVISVMSNVIDTGVDIALMMHPATMPVALLKQLVQGGAAAAAFVRDAYEVYEQTDDEGGPVGEIVLASTIIRGIADWVQARCTDLGNIASACSWAGIALAPFSEGLSAVAGEIVAAIGEIPRVGSQIATTVSGVCDLIETGGNAYLMQHHLHERNGPRYTAARGQFESGASRLVGRAISFVNDLLAEATVNLLPNVMSRNPDTGEMESVSPFTAETRSRSADIQAQPGMPSGPGGRAMADNQAGREVGAVKSEFIDENAPQIGDRGKSMIQRGVGIAIDLALGDPFKASVRNPLTGGAVADMINPERTASFTAMTEANTALGEHKPKWYQELVDRYDSGYSNVSSGIDTLNSPEGRVRLMLTPFMPFLNRLMDNAMDADPGAIADSLEAKYPDIQEAGATIRDIATQLATHKGEIDSVLTGIVAYSQEHVASLGTARTVLAQGTEFLDSLLPMVGDVRQQVEGEFDELIAPFQESIGEYTLPPLTSGMVGAALAVVPGIGGLLGLAGAAGWALLPDSIKARIQSTVQGWLNGIVAGIDRTRAGAVSQVESVKDGVLDRLEGAADGLIIRIRTKVGIMADTVQEGGLLETTLKAKQTEAEEYITQLNETIQNFNPDDLNTENLIAWLQEVVHAIRIQMNPGGDDSRENVNEQWNQVINGEAKGHIADWKAQHTDHVTQAKNPNPRAQEVAAFNRAAALVGRRIDQWERANTAGPDAQRNNSNRILAQQYRAAVTRAQGTASSAVSQGGMPGMNMLWNAEESLNQVDQMVPEAASA